MLSFKIGSVTYTKSILSFEGSVAVGLDPVGADLGEVLNAYLA